MFSLNSTSTTGVSYHQNCCQGAWLWEGGVGFSCGELACAREGINHVICKERLLLVAAMEVNSAVEEDDIKDCFACLLGPCAAFETCKHILKFLK